ncbi:MAG: HlyC/CorC family transporter [Gemmatimonadaceae bacterium]|nr:HlyC/CorC family transporter [Gemmatimonadaceae bacterium]
MLSRIGLIVLLLLVNGFFVAVEFSLVRARRTRLQAMVRAGDPLARFALHATDNLARVLSASQLGITGTSLGLGWAAESTVGVAFEGWFATLPLALEASVRLSLAAAVALIAVTYLHVVFGELTPRAAALQHPEVWAKWLAPPLLAFAWVMRPFTALLNASAALVLRPFGVRLDATHDSVHSPEELKVIVEQSQREGEIEQQDADLIGAVFEFSEKNAREVMTPRTAIVAIPAEATLDEALAIVEEAGFSRYPVYEESLDNIVGMVHAKDLLPVLRHRPATFSLGSVMREVHAVPGSREVEEVLADFKRLKEHLAIVLDEYGGTAGLVTMEDLLEELVGEILDEHDEGLAIARSAATGETLLPGLAEIGDVNEQFGVQVPDDNYTTVGGYVFGLIGRLPQVGDRVVGGGATWTVRAMDGRRIATVEMKKD